MVKSNNPLNDFDLYDLRSMGNHALHAARKKGEDTSTPLAFMGAVTVALGCKMLWEAFQKKSGHRIGGYRRGR